MIDKDMPLVSIVIPVYNGSNYLHEAIDSAIGQTYQNIEIIVINDGSNDDGETEKIARSYGNRIRYYEKENGGVASALNLGINKMSGEYFSWLSHDDRYRKGKIERQIRALMECDDRTRVALGGYVNFTDQDGIVEKMDFLRRYSKKQMETPLFAVFHRAVHGCALLIHRSHFERVGVFKSELRTTQDYDLWFRMMRGQRILYTGGMEVESRFHDGQGSRQLGREHVDACNTLWIHMFESLTAEERKEIGGSDYAFYKGLYHDMLEETDYDEAIRYLHCRLIEEAGRRIRGGDAYAKALLKRHFKLPENAKLNEEITRLQQGKEKQRTAIIASEMAYLKELDKYADKDHEIYRILFQGEMSDKQIFSWKEDIGSLVDWLTLQQVDNALISDKLIICEVPKACKIYKIKSIKVAFHSLEEQIKDAQNIIRWYNDIKEYYRVIWENEYSAYLYTMIADNGVGNSQKSHSVEYNEFDSNGLYYKDDIRNLVHLLFTLEQKDGNTSNDEWFIRCMKIENSLSWRFTAVLRLFEKSKCALRKKGTFQLIKNFLKKQTQKERE